MTKLFKLAVKHGTDKTHYAPFYSLLLDSLRDSTKKVLEIGIGSVETMKHIPGYLPGASLRMWKEYFPKALIFGLDYDASVLFQEERISTSLCDQRSQSNLLRAADWSGGELDLIVDDGDHSTMSQLLTVQTLLPYLKDGGLYIIEDVNDFKEISRALEYPHASVRFQASLAAQCVVIPTI